MTAIGQLVYFSPQKQNFFVLKESGSRGKEVRLLGELPNGCVSEGLC